MADPVTITAVVMAAAAAVSSATPVIMARRKSAREKDVTAVASWSKLNAALQSEIERQHASYQAQLDAARADYGAQLDAARQRITELETEVAALTRALRGRP